MRIILCNILLALFPLTILAEGGTTVNDSTLSSTPTSLPHLIHVGLQNNYGLQIVRNEEKIADNNATRANAGYLPTISLDAGYNADLNSGNTHMRSPQTTTKTRNVADLGFNTGISANWTVFDGFQIQANYARLQELRRQSATQTRIALEDYVANLTAAYYDYVQQRIRLHNLQNAVALSRERLRIVLERYTLGSSSRLDLQQAQVDFNADSAQSLKQEEKLATALINLNELLCIKDINTPLHISDSTIILYNNLNYQDLWQSTLNTNAHLLRAEHDKKLALIDLKSVSSRDYPYIKLNANYGYSHNNITKGTTASRDNWGGNIGVTVGFKLFDGNRKRERRNAQINIDNAELAQAELLQALNADLADLWQAYQNNLRLLALERENLTAAQENHFIAQERFMLGDLSGIEMREAQQSLLDAVERIRDAEYNTKLCEISLMQISGQVMNYSLPTPVQQ